MKANLFTTSVIDWDKLSKDISNLLQFDVKTIEKLPAITFSIIRSVTSTEQKIALKDGVKELSISEADILEVLSICNFFFKEFTVDGDAAEDDIADIANDLFEKGVIKSDSEKEKMLAFFRNIRPIAQKDFYSHLKEKNAESGPFPTLKGYIGAVDFRAIFDNEYTPSNDIRDYVPTFKKLSPIASIQIKTEDSKGESVISFQANKKHLRWLIDNMEALYKEVECAEKSIS